MLEESFKVMILDTQKFFRDAAKRVMKGLGHEVVIADKVSNALDRIKKDPPDILFIECAICEEGQNAYEIAKEVQEIVPGIPVVMCGEHPTRDVIFSSVRAGAIDFLVKPATPEVTLKKLQEALIKTGKKPPEQTQVSRIEFDRPNMTPQEKLDVLFKRVHSLLVLPHAVMKIFSVYARKDTGAKDMQKAVEADPGIAAMLLKRSNSSYYGAAEQVTKVKPAIVRIGFRETRNMVATLSVFKLFSSEQKSFGFNRVWYWLHSLATAIIAEFLSEQVVLHDDSSAFMCGLLHDLGKIVIDDYIPEEYQKVIRQAAIENIPIHKAEIEIFQRHHMEVGAHMMRQWNFSEGVIEPVRFHHATEHSCSEERLKQPDMTVILYMANQIAKCLMIGSGGDFFVEYPPPQIWQSLKLGTGIPTKVLDKIHEEVAGFLEFLQITENEVGITLGRQKDRGIAYYVDQDEMQAGLVQMYLMNTGFEIQIVNSLEKVEAGEAPVVIRVTDADKLNDMLDEAMGSEAIANRSTAIVCDTHVDKLPSSIDPLTRAFCYPLDIFSLHSFLLQIGEEAKEQEKDAEETDAEEEKEEAKSEKKD